MKYPRTKHLPNDDKRMDDVNSLLGMELVITEKMDGSNMCWTRDDIFARSHNGPPAHPSFDLAKAQHAQYQSLIPQGVSIFGEWCFAKHSIEYTELPAYFLVFGVHDAHHNWWMKWDDVVKTAEGLNLLTAPVLVRKTFRSEQDLRAIIEEIASQPSLYGPEREGLVVRHALGFADNEFATAVGKWVRKDHVQTDQHWMHGPIIKQGLK